MKNISCYVSCLEDDCEKGGVHKNYLEGVGSDEYHMGGLELRLPMQHNADLLLPGHLHRRG